MSPKDQTDRITATPSAPVCSAVTPSGPFADLFPAELRWGQILALLAIIAVAMAYRLSFFASETMPILDGGMFHEFIAAVEENDLWLPPTAIYNHNELPFAYPPLSFWLGAWLHTTFEVEIVQVLRVYPFVMHLIYLAMLVPLWRGFGLPWTGALMALALALMIYQSFEWLIMGGGLTRATGAALTISAGAAAAWGMRASRVWLLAVAGVLAGLSALTHLLWGTFAVMLCTTAVLSIGTTWSERLRALAIGAGIVAAMLVPWIAWVVSHHGLAPFVNTSAGGMRGTHQFYLTARAQLFPSFLTYFCVIGVWECLRRKVYVWPLLALAIMIVTPRNYWNMALLTNATLAAVGVMAVWGWIVDRLGEIRRRGGTPDWVPRLADWNRAWVPTALAAAWTFLGSFSDISSEIMSSLKDSHLEAMEWVDRRLPPEAKMLVISHERWFADEVSEWMPVLTQVKSIRTVQSTEWLPDEFFTKQIRKVERLRPIAYCSELVEEIGETWWQAEYVFVVAELECLEDDPHFIEIYATPEEDVDGDAPDAEVHIYRLDLFHQAD